VKQNKILKRQLKSEQNKYSPKFVSNEKNTD